MAKKRKLRLSDGDFDKVVKCMRAMAEGPFVEDPEFGTVMGCSRMALRNWLLLNERTFDEEATAMALSSINTLVGFPHKREPERFALTGLEKHQILELRSSFRKAAGMAQDESYFGNLM